MMLVSMGQTDRELRRSVTELPVTASDTCRQIEEVESVRWPFQKLETRMRVKGRNFKRYCNRRFNRQLGQLQCKIDE